MTDAGLNVNALINEKCPSPPQSPVIIIKDQAPDVGGVQ